MRNAYLRMTLLLMPALVTWVFAGLFLQPKLELIWRESSLNKSNAQWLISLSTILQGSFLPIVICAVLFFILLDLYTSSWKRFRQSVIFSSAVILNAAVLVWCLTIATAALMAAPNIH